MRRWRRVATFAPLAMLSTGWTAAIAGVGVTASSADERQGEVPGYTGAPDQAIEAPASVSDTRRLGLGVRDYSQEIVVSSSTNGIPAVALAAYQRAESVINRADTSCNLTWQLVAAIGRVESDHGRVQGNALDDDGVAVPGIYGIALTGKGGTNRVEDTDAGRLDDHTVWDRAVGPMQFIPGTWSTMGVDGDGDGRRDPQDIEDSALATAVYLCSGNDDLSTPVGRRAAVYRYNHSQSYVDLVLRIMQAYLDGAVTPVPDNIVSAGPVAPAPTSAAPDTVDDGREEHDVHPPVEGGWDPVSAGEEGDDAESEPTDDATENPDDHDGPTAVPSDDPSTMEPEPSDPPSCPSDPGAVPGDETDESTEGPVEDGGDAVEGTETDDDAGPGPDASTCPTPTGDSCATDEAGGESGNDESPDDQPTPDCG